jgi:hypothetical protein
VSCMRRGLLQELARLVESAPVTTVHCSFAARPSPPSDCTVQEHLAVVVVAVVLIMMVVVLIMMVVVVVAAPRSARVGEHNLRNKGALNCREH